MRHGNFILLMCFLAAVILITGCNSANTVKPQTTSPRSFTGQPAMVKKSAIPISATKTSLSFKDWQIFECPEGISKNNQRQVIRSVTAWINDGTVSDELASLCTGKWLIDIQSAGLYRLTLRLLPEESNTRLSLRPGRAYLNCGNVAAERTIAGGESFMEFELELEQGQSELEVYLTNQLPDRRNLTVFYVDIQQL